MILNRLEFVAMNNPLRAFIQRHCEARRLKNMGGDISGGRALEMGCGRGVGVEIILDVFRAASVDAFDLDPRMIRRAQKRLRHRREPIKLWIGDATRIDAPDAIYDAVFDFGIIHHIPDWRASLREVRRVLKPGGRFYTEEMLRAFIVHPIWRATLDHPQQDRFDHEQYKTALREAGFNVTADKKLGNSIGWYVAESI